MVKLCMLYVSPGHLAATEISRSARPWKCGS